MDNLIISACLLGTKCRYDGGHNRIEQIERLKERYHLIPVCPEIYGGMTTPRTPSEICGNCVINKNGIDVTECFLKGALETLKLAQVLGCTKALLKEKSPSCGSGYIYSGDFSNTLVKGDGVTASLLKKNGIYVFGEKDLDYLIE